MLKLNNNGDTIVEVLIALAVLSLAFVISYATANAALLASQNAQEHSLALEYLDAQIEALRYVANQPNQLIIPQSEFHHSNSAFCLQPGGSDVSSSAPFNPSHNASSYPPSCRLAANGFSYYVDIQPDPSLDNDFHVQIWWNGLGKLGIQSEELSYRVYSQ